MSAPASAHGIILFAHGSRDPVWHRPIQAVAEKIRSQSPQTPVACAYLELSSPNLHEAAQMLIDQGIQHLSITPLFLGVGKHAREDLPSLVQAIQAQHPQIAITCHNAIGEEARVIELLASIALGHKN